jgi:hypothetical protein
VTVTVGAAIGVATNPASATIAGNDANAFSGRLLMGGLGAPAYHRGTPGAGGGPEMGRQIHFHAWPEDLQTFLAFAQGRDPVTVTLMDSDRPEITPLADPAHQTATMTLWNEDLVTGLERSLVERPPHPSYYRVARTAPVLELSPSLAVSWDNRPALVGGRLYCASLEAAHAGRAKWYEALRRWIRTRFRRVAVADSYVGPAASAWFDEGGILLPQFAPPVTPAWEAHFSSQDILRRPPTARR